jgi:peptide/nickel transport system permease protein
MVLGGLTVLFLLLKIVPGMSGSHYISTAFNVERQQELLQLYENNGPFVKQLLMWFKNALTLDFGNSLQSGEAVSRIIINSLLPTVLLTLLAILWGLLISLPMAFLSALKKNSLTDRLISILMVILFAIPSYWIGMLLLYNFSIKIQLFPSSQLLTISDGRLSLLEKLPDLLHHLALPSLALGVGFAAYFFKYLKPKLMDILDSDFILAARARGLSGKVIVFSHILPNLGLTLLALVSTVTPAIFSGAVTIEYIFSIPGLGKTMINAALSRDIPLIMGGAAVSFLAIILLNSIIELLISIINPKTGPDQ